MCGGGWGGGDVEGHTLVVGSVFMGEETVASPQYLALFCCGDPATNWRI